MKQKCARKAFEMIEPGMAIGLGGGATVALLIQELEQHPKQITAVSPSLDTIGLCVQHHIPILPLELASHIDLAFDGCDELDDQLNALKSCGGIHTREKITAAMATEYILLADESKLGKRLSFGVPVALEVLPSARSYVKASLTDMGADVTERRGSQKAGLAISDDGNYLMDACFFETPDIRLLSDTLDRTPGIIGHSLFYQIASKAIIAGEAGVRVLERSTLQTETLAAKTNTIDLERTKL